MKTQIGNLIPSRDYFPTFKAGDRVIRYANAHPDFPRWHTICGEKKHAKEQAILESRIVSWCLANVFTVTGLEPSGVCVRDAAGNQFCITGAFTLFLAD